MKAAAILAALPLASAFVAPVPKMTRGRSLQMKAYPFADEPACVKWFPDSAPYWDPMGLSLDASPELYWRLQNGEIKNGRVAMLACMDYIVKGALGFKLPFMLGLPGQEVAMADIPGGLAAIKAVPGLGWLQIIFYCGFLEYMTDPNQGWPKPGKVPGNLQPDIAVFKAPGDKSIRAKEVNNGRMAMMAIFGMWAGEIVTGGQQPFEILAAKLAQ